MRNVIAAVIAALTLTGTASGGTVHMYGDSIFKGWGFGQYDHPSPLNRIDRIAALMAGGKVGFNRTSEQAPSQICGAVKAGEIRRGDTIIFENAGPHFNNNTKYRRWLEGVAWCSRKHKLVLTTMFDYNPDPVTVPFSTYDDPVGAGGSVNSLVAAFARQKRVGLIDWNYRMDWARAALQPLGVKVVHDDGIHPTPWGNILMAASLVKQQGLSVKTVAVVDALMLAQPDLVVRNLSPAFTRVQAEAWLRLLTGSRP